MKRIFKHMLWGLLSWVGACSAWTPYDREAAKRDEVAKDAAWKMDHLAPAGSADTRNHCTLTYKVVPSFAPSEEWCIYSKGKGHVIRIQRVTESDSTSADVLQDPVEVELPDEIVVAVRDVWVNGILEARYPRIISRGMDGAVHTFGARIVSCGLCLAETWSPHVDLPPLWLVETGEALRTYARATDRDSESLHRMVSAHRDRLFAYYRQHGKH
jgi:hypothetical protein